MARIASLSGGLCLRAVFALAALLSLAHGVVSPASGSPYTYQVVLDDACGKANPDGTYAGPRWSISDDTVSGVGNIQLKGSKLAGPGCLGINGPAISGTPLGVGACSAIPTSQDTWIFDADTGMIELESNPTLCIWLNPNNAAHQPLRLAPCSELTRWNTF